MDKARMLWRYGFSAPTKTTAMYVHPFREPRLHVEPTLTLSHMHSVKSLVTNLLKAYSYAIPVWTSVEELSQACGFTEHTSKTALEFFTSQGVGEKWVQEMVEASTRVNYGQDITAIHGLGGAASMAATGASQVKGGVGTSYILASETQLIIEAFSGLQNYQVCFGFILVECKVRLTRNRGI